MSRQGFHAALMLAVSFHSTMAEEPSQPVLTSEERILASRAWWLSEVGEQAFRRGKYDEALAKMEQALELRRKIYTETRFPNGHKDLDANLTWMGYLLQRQGAFEKALPYYEQSLEMCRKLYPKSKFPDGHVSHANTLTNLAELLHAKGAFEKALFCFDQALAIFRKLYPATKDSAGNAYFAQCLCSLGRLQQSMGALDQALTCFEQSLTMYRKCYPDRRYPDGHPDVATVLNNVGMLFKAQGAYDKALPYHEQALAMRRKLYPEIKHPDGHPHLAQSLNNVGALLNDRGDFEKGLHYYKLALEMHHQLYPTAKYPDGHPHLAVSLNNMGILLQGRGSYEKARPYLDQALAMKRRIYAKPKFPNGHPDLAQSLGNLGILLFNQGVYEEAQTHFDQALAMRRAFYAEAQFPDGHPDLANSLSSLGSLHFAGGDLSKAWRLLGQALAMERQLAGRVLLTSSESESLAYLQAQPLTRDLYLSVAARIPHTASAAYQAVWQSKATVTRLLEVRQARARAGGTAAMDQLARLQAIRRRTEQVLLDGRMKADERQKLIADLADERDRIERDLARALPILERWKELDQTTPEDLARALSADAVYIDLLASTDFSRDPKVRGKAGERRIPSYTAFVVARGQGTRRIELGSAAPIDAAIRAWRVAIDQRRHDAAAETLRQRIWAPIAKHLPAGVRTIYLSPDSDLARLPWAALPIGDGRVLLEEFAVAVVPHGPFLLAALKHARPNAGPDSLLVVGDVTYNSSTWPTLPGTLTEINSIASLVSSECETLSKADATAARLAQRLPGVRFAHLATHGEFKASEYATERQREQDARQRWQEGASVDTRLAAARNPLGFVGLVLAQGEIITGLRILDLNLEKLNLLTLSACETGLGEYTGGKGVENLQQAFHLAGCPNVVASLWKVNDAATAALMAKFYHELWIHKKPPLEALREAQLIIHTRPDLIPELAGERGAPSLKKAVAVNADSTGINPAARPARADIKLWAGFILSGSGR